MKTIYSNVKRSFLRPAPASTLGYFRIAIGCFALVQTIFLLPDWMAFYGQKGLVPWEVSEALSTTNTPSLFSVFRLLLPLHVSPDATVYIVTIVYLLALFGLAIGYCTRVMGIAAWLLHIVLTTTGHFTAYGVETFTSIALFYCMVLPVGCSLSIDAGKAKKLPHYLITLSVRLLQLHLCIMYLACGIEKALGEQWWNGEAIWMAMQQDQFHTININWMADLPLVPKLLCWSTLLIETLYPVGIFWHRTKRFWLLAIISLHLFTGIFLGLHLFATIMILLNVTAFGQHCFADFNLTQVIGSIRQRFSSQTTTGRLPVVPVCSTVDISK